MAAANSFGVRRFRLLAIPALLAAFTLLVGVHGAGAAATSTPTVALTASPTSATAGQPVTLSVTVSPSLGGYVDFYNQTSTGRIQLDVVDGPVAVVNGLATWTWYPAYGDYNVIAVVTSSGSNYVSNTVAVTVQSATAALHTTAMQLTVDPSTIETGQTVTIKAAITETDGVQIPTGSVVFTSSPSDNPSSSTTLGDGPVALDANGVATLSNVGGWVSAGTYTINASYAGDVLDKPISSTYDLGVTQAPSTSVTTTTVVTSAPANPQIGQTVTLVAHVSQVGNPTPPPAGDAVDFRATSIYGTDVELDTAPLQPDGTATITVSFPHAVDYTVTASYVGDIFQHILASSGRTTVSVGGPHATTLSYLGPAQVDRGSTATLQAKLLDVNGAAVADEPVTLTVDTGPETCTATTDTQGIASCGVLVNDTAGGHAVHATFAGDAGHLASSTLGTLQVLVPDTTSLTYTGPTDALGGAPVALSFVLADTVTSTPVAGQTVAISFGGTTYTTTTDVHGIASVPLVAPSSAGTYAVGGSFAGVTGYLASTGSGSLKVTMIPTTTTYTGDTQTVVGAHATLSATLVATGTGTPLASEPITLSFGSETCTAPTDSSGYAACGVVVGDVPGSYTVTASFAGDAGHVASSGGGTIVVGQATTSTVDNVSGTYLAGSAVSLSGTLSANGAPLAGKTLSLTFGSASCSGLTGANGIATCATTVPTASTGPVTPTASFGGDVSYKPSSGSSTALVYGLAPGGGSFVVGDRTASGSVYFWGSQWWKQNVLSAGNAQAVDPGSFKGFAATPAGPQCGGTWSTAPGNSTPPPSGPLPAYMAVAVTSQNAKSGSTLSGSIVHVVVVKTNAGYDGNPGHDGTGTVVATVC